jgi:hypothetical protein
MGNIIEFPGAAPDERTDENLAELAYLEPYPAPEFFATVSDRWCA